MFSLIPFYLSFFFSAGYGERGVDFAYEGVAPPKFKDGYTPKTLHAYYQWVPFVLFLQGIMFYFPHYLWKLLEDRKLDKITKDLRGNQESISTDCFALPFINDARFIS